VIPLHQSNGDRQQDTKAPCGRILSQMILCSLRCRPNC